jgi:NAD+ kinase
MKNNKRSLEVQNIAIIYRHESPTAFKYSVQLAKWLQKKKLTVYSHPDQVISKNIKKLTTALIKKLDLVIVLGGDGTYLQAVLMLNGEKAPIIGINMGSLGFLTQNRKEDMYATIELALSGKMEKRPRSMLEVKLQRDGKIIKKANALNDVVLERGSVSRLVNISIYSEKQLVGQVKADGILIATPTGSTAYNLAAGGPILHPYVNAFVVSPICPHSLTHRPIIFPDNQTLTFRLLNKKHRAYLTIDGQTAGDLKSGDKIIITRATCDHYILRKPGQNYFDLLREKLKFAER